MEFEGKIIENAEREMGITKFEHSSLEAYTVGKEEKITVLKVSSPEAVADIPAAELMHKYFKERKLYVIQDPEYKREIIVHTKDFKKLFGEE